MYVRPCIMYENDKRYQLDAKIMIFIIKYINMFPASICPSSGVQVVCYCIRCSAQGFVAVVPRSLCVVLCTVRKFVTDTQCTRLHTGCLEPQLQHYVQNTVCSNIQNVLLMMGI